MAAYSMFPHVLHLSACVHLCYTLYACVCFGGYWGRRSNDNIDAVLTASEVASTPSSQCVVARQPRVRCSRAALFVPYEWFARESKDGRRWGWEKEIHKLVNGRPSLEGPGINASANSLSVSLHRHLPLYFCFTVSSGSFWFSFFNTWF